MSASTPADTSANPPNCAEACPTSKEKELNATVKATSTYTGTTRPNTRRGGMPLALSTSANARAAIASPTQVLTKKSVTE